MHRLYLTLRSCLPEKEESYLIDELEKMVDRMEDETVLFKALDILYPKKVDRQDPLKLLLLFVQGLKVNEFFEYVEFINGIRRGRRS